MCRTRVIEPTHCHDKLNGASTWPPYQGLIARQLGAGDAYVIDILTLGLTHGLMAIALWRLLSRDDLGRDDDEPVAPRRPWQREIPSPTDDAA
jgi:hypothetical protein